MYKCNKCNALEKRLRNLEMDSETRTSFMKLPKEKLVGLVDERFRERYGDDSPLQEEENPFIDDFTGVALNDAVPTPPEVSHIVIDPRTSTSAGAAPAQPGTRVYVHAQLTVLDALADKVMSPVDV